jgi:hypothetical protein
MNNCWYHLTDKALVLNQDVITKLSKLVFIVTRLIEKPVDEYIQSITGNDAYNAPAPNEEHALLLQAMPTETRTKTYEEVEITLKRRDKTDDTYSTAEDFVWDYTATSHRGQGTVGNWKIQERTYSRDGDVTGKTEVMATYDQFWMIQEAMDGRRELPSPPGFHLDSEYPLTFNAKHLTLLRNLEMVVSTYLAHSLPKVLNMYATLEAHPEWGDKNSIAYQILHRLR